MKFKSKIEYKRKPEVGRYFKYNNNYYKLVKITKTHVHYAWIHNGKELRDTTKESNGLSMDQWMNYTMKNDELFYQPADMPQYGHVPIELINYNPNYAECYSISN